MNDDSLEQTLQNASLIIIMTDTPEKLGKTLNKFLILFITHATASDERIRKICAETLAHINKRLSQQSTTIQLPILSLLEKTSPLCDIYLNHAFNNLSNYPDSVIKSVGKILFEKYPESIYNLKFFGYDLAVQLAPEIKTLPGLFYDFMLYDGKQNCTGISLNKVAIFNKFASRNGVEDVGMILTTKLQIVAFIAKHISVLPEPELSLFYLLGLHCSGEQKIKTVCQRDWGKLPRNAIEESSRMTKLQQINVKGG